MTSRSIVVLAIISSVVICSAPTSSAQTVSFSPTSLTFGSVVVGTSSSPQPITLTNTGSATLNVTKVQMTSPNAPDFGQTNNCTQVLAGAFCTINVTFTPTTSGARSANVRP